MIVILEASRTFLTRVLHIEKIHENSLVRLNIFLKCLACHCLWRTFHCFLIMRNVKNAFI